MIVMEKIAIALWFLLFLLLPVTSSSMTKVLIIGSGKFFDKSIIELPGAINDARLFKETVLSLGIASPENINYIENPPSGVLTASIYEFFVNCEPQDRLILYYSGHGYTESGKTYLIPYDVRSNLISKTAYNLTDELQELLAKTKAQEIVVIMDACYSGGIVKDRPITNVRIDKMSLEEMAMQKNIVFLLSSAPNEVSQEKPTGGGWFTHYLIEGLRGEAGKEKEFITTTDLYNYVRNAVSKQTFNRQNPQLIGTRSIVLTVNKKELYKRLIAEVSVLGVEGKIPKEYVPLYAKILVQEESKDTVLESKIRNYLLVYGNDKNLNALLAQTKLALLEGKEPPDETKPETSSLTGRGTCLLKIYAGNELAKSAKVFINEIESGNLASGIFEALDLVLGKHVVALDGDKIERFEKEIIFTYQYEVQEIKFVATPATRPVRVQTEPSLAKVYIDGKEVGTSTWQGTLEVGKIYEIAVKKEGYRSETRKINVSTKGDMIPIVIKLSPNNPPEQPKVISPADGAKDLPTEVVLKWESKDPDGDEVTYDLYFGIDPNNLKLVEKGLKVGETKISSLLPDTLYYWRVVVSDTYGTQTLSKLYRFTTAKLTTINLNKLRIKWQRALGGTNLEGFINACLSMDGTVVISGLTESGDGDIVGYRGGVGDFWALKIASDGQIIWNKTFGGTGREDSHAIRQTKDYGYILAGATSSRDGDVKGLKGGFDGWIVKLSTNGEIEWQRCLGGSNFDDFYDVELTNDNGYIFIGYSMSNDKDVSKNFGYRDIWVVKTDSRGSIQWERSFGGTGDDFGEAVVQTLDGGYVIVGYSNSKDGDLSGLNKGDYDWFISKLDQNGNVVWKRTIGGSGDDKPFDILETSDGSLIVVGYVRSKDGDINKNFGSADAFVVKLDPKGNVIWKRNYGGSSSEGFGSAIETEQKNYIIVGSTNSVDGDVESKPQNTDAWIVELDPNSGVILSQLVIGGKSDDYGTFFSKLKNGDYIFVGSTTSSDIPGYKGYIDLWIANLSYK